MVEQDFDVPYSFPFSFHPSSPVCNYSSWPFGGGSYGYQIYNSVWTNQVTGNDAAYNYDPCASQPPVCSPTTSCAAQGKDCGQIWNGCAYETCGSCSSGQTCSNNVCVCSPTTSCAAQGKNCGQIWNGCAYETCGSCSGGQTCSNNVCVCSPTTSCAAQGKNCGQIWNGCAYETCGSYGGGCQGGQSCSNNVCQASGGSAYYCYSSTFPWYYFGFQTWLCNPAYNPTFCYTASWQWTACPSSGGSSSGSVCGNGTCEAGENSSNCPQDCCDQSTPCGQTKQNQGVYYCRNMYHYEPMLGYGYWQGFKWVTANDTTQMCNESYEAMEGTTFQTQYQCGGYTGKCHLIPGGYY